MEQRTAIHHLHAGWRINDGTFISLSIATIVLTWTLLMVAYPILPSTIPTHYGFSGLPDAQTTKSWWSVFFPAVLQVVLTGLTWWLSRHPEYSNLPSSLPLRVVPEPTQTKIRRIIAHLLVMTGVLVNLIFANISLGMVRISLGLADRLDSWVVLGFVAFLLFLMVVYSVWMARLTKAIHPQSPSISNQ